MKKHYAMALLIAAPLGPVALAHHAADHVDGPDMAQIRTEIVHFDAAAIHDRKAARKLFFRFRQTAEEVCRLSSNPVGYEMWEERACEAEAVADAVRQARLPALDAYYYGMPTAVLSARR